MTLYILEYLTESYIHYFDLKYREHVKLLHNLCIHERLSLKVVTYSISDNIMS